MNAAALLVLCNCPDRAVAEAIAADLVGEGLAACVNILAPCRSVYRWQGEVESAEEVPLLIKARAEAFAVLQDRIVALHPYDVPEIIALPITQGLPAYLQWLAAETRAN